MRPRVKLAVVPLLLVVALAGCGGDASSDDSSSAEKTNAANSPEVKKLIRQTFGANKNATSGKVSGTIDVVIKGVPRYREPVQLTLSGPFTTKGGTPQAGFSVGLALRGGAIGGELYLVDDRVLIGLGSTAYTIPDSIARSFRKTLTNSNNTLASLLRAFQIDPQRWAKNPRIVGNERVAGEDTIHGTAELDKEQFFLDVANLTKRLTSLRITEITGLPTKVDRKARVALARSVTKANGDVYTGAEDHVLRRAGFDIALKMSAKDRKTLGGISSMTIKGQLDVTEVGTPQKIETPKVGGTFADLQVTFDALAESVR